jgi:hypothetical protein
MAIAIVVEPSLGLKMEAIAKAKIQHPTTHRATFINVPIQVTFSLGSDGLTPTATLARGLSDLWPFEDEVTKTFDAEGLG